jgi:large subunit ribosomal protein L16
MFKKKPDQPKNFVLYKIPKYSKIKRYHKGRIRGFEFNAVQSQLRYGKFGLKILKGINLREKHIKAIRETLQRKKLLTKAKPTLLIRGIFNIPVSKKPNEIRMGKGKGAIDHWILRVKPGRVLFELTRIVTSVGKALRILKVIQFILGVPIQLVSIQTYYKNFRVIKIFA